MKMKLLLVPFSEALKLPNMAHGNMEIGLLTDQCKYFQHYLDCALTGAGIHWKLHSS